MNEISFTGNLYFDKSFKKISVNTAESTKKILKDFFGKEKIQKAIPEDVYFSVSKCKDHNNLFVNIKDAENTKFQTLLYDNTENFHIIKDLFVYIYGRHKPEQENTFRKLFEKDYILNMVKEILSNM